MNHTPPSTKQKRPRTLKFPQVLKLHNWILGHREQLAHEWEGRPLAYFTHAASAELGFEVSEATFSRLARECGLGSKRKPPSARSQDIADRLEAIERRLERMDTILVMGLEQLGCTIPPELKQ